MIKASEFMCTDEVAVTPGHTVWAALAVMRTRGVRSLAVVEDGRVVGVISVRNFRKIFERVHPDGTLHRVFDVRVDHVMTPLNEAHPARRQTPLRDIADWLAEERIDCVPVVDGEDRLVGMLRYEDVIRGLLAIVARLEARESLRNVRMLVVDDDADNRELLRQIFEAEGAIVTVADSAERALEAIQDTVPAVLVTDLAMPTHDGYWLLAQLRQRSPLPPIAAVALTGFDNAFDRRSALTVGFHDYLVKPVEAEHLCRAVASAIGRS